MDSQILIKLIFVDNKINFDSSSNRLNKNLILFSNKIKDNKVDKLIN